MKWNVFQDLDSTPPPPVKKIEVRQLGISKVVFVRTKGNGGINCNRTKIFTGRVK